MNEKILIVEDEFIVATDLRLILEKEGYKVTGIAGSVEEALELWGTEAPDIVLLDIYLKGKLTGIDLAKKLREGNIPFVYLSANSSQRILEEAKATQPDGFLVKPFRVRDVLITLDIARYRHEHSVGTLLRKEARLQDKLEDLLSAGMDQRQLLSQLAKIIQPFIAFDYLAAIYRRAGGGSVRCLGMLRIGKEEYQAVAEKELSVITGLKTAFIEELNTVLRSHFHIQRYNGPGFADMFAADPLRKTLITTFQLASMLELSIHTDNGSACSFCFFSRSEDAYDAEDVALMHRVAPILSVVGHAFVADGGSMAGMQAAPVSPAGFEGVVGKSSALQQVLESIRQVAGFDTSVLIMGESGTGKELVADCIRQLSTRRDKPFVKVNCAALPATLIEAELFGYEKGAFTGAGERRVGKFEQANEGTIFLDEIGEMPLELQSRLLRVLQEREVERIGGKGPVRINVRFIAATNRNLDKEVAEGRFRLDLYYRLNVFPLVLPALRDRGEDIPLLADHYGRRYCNAMHKRYSGISRQMMDQLMAYHWPGNVRELENIIEQSVILNNGQSELKLKRPLCATPEAKGIHTMEDIRRLQAQTEKEHIIAILRQTKGRIRGEGGAAELLHLKPTTLESRISKLGIRKDEMF